MSVTVMHTKSIGTADGNQNGYHDHEHAYVISKVQCADKVQKMYL